MTSVVVLFRTNSATTDEGGESMRSHSGRPLRIVTIRSAVVSTTISSAPSSVPPVSVTSVPARSSAVSFGTCNSAAERSVIRSGGRVDEDVDGTGVDGPDVAVGNADDDVGIAAPGHVARPDDEPRAIGERDVARPIRERLDAAMRDRPSVGSTGRPFGPVVDPEDPPETGFEPAALFRLLIDEIAAAFVRATRSADEFYRFGLAGPELAIDADSRRFIDTPMALPLVTREVKRDRSGLVARTRDPEAGRDRRRPPR